MAEYTSFGGQGGNLNMPAYKQPKYDKEQVGLYGQQQMAPGLASLRRGYQQTTGQYSENPAERDALARQAMAGYGQGLGQLQAAGTQAGMGLYQQEYAGLEKQAQMDYQRAMNMWKMKQVEDAQKKALQVQQAQPQQAMPHLGTVYSPGYATPLTNQFAGQTAGAGQPVGYFGQALTPGGQPMQYKAESPEAYKQAMYEGDIATGGYPGAEGQGLQGWDLGGGKSGLSLLSPQAQQHLSYNPFMRG